MDHRSGVLHGGKGLGYKERWKGRPASLAATQCPFPLQVPWTSHPPNYPCRWQVGPRTTGWGCPQVSMPTWADLAGWVWGGRRSLRGAGSTKREARRGSWGRASAARARARGGSQAQRRPQPTGPREAVRGAPLAPAAAGGAGRGGRGGAWLTPPTGRGPEPGARAEPSGGARAAGGRRRQWERRGRRRLPGRCGHGRPRHEPRRRAPPGAARGPRRAASASPGPHAGAGDALPGPRMMVDCQVSATPGPAALPGASPATPHPARAYAVPRPTPPGTRGKLRPGGGQSPEAQGGCQPPRPASVLPWGFLWE